MSEKAAQPQEFQGWRNIFWPIHNYELKKFLPMGLMMLFILFNYTLMRDTKDTMVVNAPGSGSEVLAFIKLCGVLPAAVLFMLLYVKMANAMSSQKIFYTLITSFGVLFALFGFVLYPNLSHLNASPETLASWRAACPRLHWPLAMVANWVQTLFYIMSELWGSVAISMLFWQFANATTQIHESKRFYAFYGLVGNLGLIASSQVLKFGAYIGKKVEASGAGDGYIQNLRIITIGILIGCAATMFIYSWIQKNVLTDPKLFDPSKIKAKKAKPKLSLGESFKCIMKSPYLGLILILVLGYNICINLIEMTWKGQLKLAFAGDKNAYSSFMGTLSFWTAIFTICFTFIGMNVLRRCKWITAALVNPLIVLTTGLAFFGLLIYSRNMVPDTPFSFLGITGRVVMWTVWVGLIQNVACKGTKYSLFDSTKQMAYIPLDPELKTKGQAAVEVVGGRFGKSGGAAIQVIMLTACAPGTTLLSLSPILAPIVLVLATCWLVAVFGLNKKFLALTAQREAEAAEEKATEA